MQHATLAIERTGHAARIWLDRPDKHNAFDEVLIAELSAALETLQADGSVRVIVLGGRGKSFCAGADLDWMRRAGSFTPEENMADARALARLFKLIYRSPVPVIARIHGAALAGGTGLAAACDIVVASEDARFGLSEVRLGLMPATIGPYVADAIGIRQARRYFLTAERFDARTALQLGLVHECVPLATLDARVDELVDALCLGAPHAMRETRALLMTLRDKSPLSDALLDNTAGRIAALRSAPEAREGLAAFFDKRPPAWQETPT